MSALEVRKRFGQLLDEAAAGERLVIERAGVPIAALVPLSDLPEANREARIRSQLEAIQAIVRLAKQWPSTGPGGAELIRRQRDERTQHLARLSEQERDRTGAGG